MLSDEIRCRIVLVEIRHAPREQVHSVTAVAVSLYIAMQSLVSKLPVSAWQYKTAWLIADVQMGYGWGITPVIKDFTKNLEAANPHKHWVCENLPK